jgi:acyl transferase domain-containing protein
MQLAILAVLNNWGIRCQSVVGHSSGEIAAAVAAGYLTPEEAIKVAYYRGKAASNIQDVPKDAVGMLAVGLGTEKVQQYLLSVSSVEIGCINSPNSVTLSGNLVQLTGLKTAIQQDGYFAQILRVDLAYHSSFMAEIAARYNDLLVQNCELPLIGGRDVAMFSSVTGKINTDGCDAGYWTSNMVSPVLFNQAMHEMISDPAGAEFLIEVGPSGALARPIAEIKQSMTGSVATLEYVSACKRGPDAVQAIFDMAGRLFISGASINMLEVNRDLEPAPPSIIIDLPNYVWNHSIKYWYESEASKDWRFRKFPNHDLLGSKILGTAWTAPSWRKTLKVQDLPWLKDHKVSST